MADSFDVRDANGYPAFQLRGAHMSMREVWLIWSTQLFLMLAWDRTTYF